MDRHCHEEDMKAVVFTLGCKVNSCESASLKSGLEKLGYETSEELSFADLYIINTCAVTAEAEKKSRQAIARARKYNPDCKIIVTGCASEKSPKDFLAKNNVTLVTGAKSKDRILSMLDERGEKFDESDEYYEEYLPARTDRERAYIKVQDGCDNFCSYCIIPYLRGRSRSRKKENVLKEIEYLNPEEAVVTGINLSAYDKKGEGLTGLIDYLRNVDCRIRLGSLEINVITPDLLLSLKNLKDFAPHFHLSLQSGSNAVLKSMNRHYTREEFAEKCNLIREYFPDAAITTDIIVGYSTETEKDFEDSVNLAETVRFADIHCFPYSRREGTVGAKLKELPPKVKDERMKALTEVKNRLKRAFIERNINTLQEFIPEETEDGYTSGYTGNYIKCYVKGEIRCGRHTIKLTDFFKDGAVAELCADRK